MKAQEQKSRQKWCFYGCVVLIIISLSSFSHLFILIIFQSYPHTQFIRIACLGANHSKLPLGTYKYVSKNDLNCTIRCCSDTPMLATHAIFMLQHTRKYSYLCDASNHCLFFFMLCCCFQFFVIILRLLCAIKHFFLYMSHGIRCSDRTVDPSISKSQQTKRIKAYPQPNLPPTNRIGGPTTPYRLREQRKNLYRHTQVKFKIFVCACVQNICNNNCQPQQIKPAAAQKLESLRQVGC